MGWEAIAVAAGSGGSLMAGIWGYLGWVGPKLKKIHEHRKAQSFLEQAMQDVLLGRPAGRDNPVTGERGAPELPGIAKRLHALESSQEFQIGKLHEIHAEIELQNQQRFKNLEDAVVALHSELLVLQKAVVKGVE